MNFTGKEVIKKIADNLNAKGKMCHDSDIILEIRQMTRQQFAELATFGTLAIWEKK